MAAILGLLALPSGLHVWATTQAFGQRRAPGTEQATPSPGPVRQRRGCLPARDRLHSRPNPETVTCWDLLHVTAVARRTLSLHAPCAIWCDSSLRGHCATTARRQRRLAPTDLPSVVRACAPSRSQQAPRRYSSPRSASYICRLLTSRYTVATYPLALPLHCSDIPLALPLHCSDIPPCATAAL
jgi:hypothetical protein